MLADMMQASDGAAELKARIRRDVRAARRARTPAAGSAARVGFTERLAALAEDTGARTIAAYTAVAGEPDPAGFLARVRERGDTVLLPAIRPERRLEWRTAGAMRVGAYGIPEPAGDAADAELLAAVDLLIVPACAVDTAGMRLGWGGGYYDRTLAAWRPRPPVYALVHDDEVRETVPREAHDAPVDGIVTPTRILHIAERVG